MTTIRIAIIGCGAVGSAVARLLLANRQSIAARSSIDIELAAIVDRSYTQARKHNLPQTLFQPEIDRVINDSTISLIVQLIGGKDNAKALMEQILERGKHVVTANKALLAHHGAALFAQARTAGLCIGFEASCGGGIPLINSLVSGLAANSIQAIYGILNGTCNYILTEMSHRNVLYQDALATAKEKGIAEANPDLDVQGYDTTHKIAILSSLAFGMQVDCENIYTKGITDIECRDIAIGKQMGYALKLLTVAYRSSAHAHDIIIWTRPAFLLSTNPLARVEGTFNAVSIYGDVAGHSLYYGRGAGGCPTASAILSDIISIGQGALPALFASYKHWQGRDMQNTPCKQIPQQQFYTRFYLRFTAAHNTTQTIDKKTIQDITAILEKAHISTTAPLFFSAADVECSQEQACSAVLCTAEPCMEQSLQQALQAIHIPLIQQIPIVHAHDEKLCLS